MQWALYELSRHPTIQQQLHDEVTSVTPLGKVPTNDDLQKMPLLKAVVKEILRLWFFIVLPYYFKINQTKPILERLHLFSRLSGFWFSVNSVII